MKRGYLALYRKIQDHPFYKEARIFSKYEAWIDILMEVQHSTEPKDVIIGMTCHICNYGESLKSVKTWSKRWGWTESKTRRYFILLENMNQIRTKSDGKTTRLSVINYSVYDPKRRDADEMPTRCRRDADEMPTTDNNVKNVNNEKNVKKFLPPSVADVEKYCTERNNGINPQQFIDHYESNGWMRGKNKIKDWKACVRTWENKRKEDLKPKQQQLVPDWM